MTTRWSSSCVRRHAVTGACNCGIAGAKSVTSEVMPEDNAYNRIIVNNSHAVMQPDGSCRIVIAHRDPGTPNWLNPLGHRQGVVFFRWLMPEQAPEPPTASLIKLTPSE